VVPSRGPPFDEPRRSVLARTFATPEAFRMALEQRLRTEARKQDRDLARLRQLLVFDRFLSRVFHHLGDNVIAKGGITLELRLDRARTTKDVDLWMRGDAARTLDRLRELGELDLGDFLSFTVEPDKDHPVMKGEGMVYEGRRFRGEARLAGKVYGGRFGIDVGFADAITVEPDLIEGSSFLDFAQAERTTMRIYPRVTHVAEKLHAYTLPRERQNTRVKDLPDLALLASLGSMNGAELRNGIDATFTFRKTHAVPAAVPEPPSSWEPVYARMASEDDLPWRTIADLMVAVQCFLNPVLRGPTGSWDHKSWSWSGG
jgi:hypothetical protein